MTSMVVFTLERPRRLALIVSIAALLFAVGCAKRPAILDRAAPPPTGAVGVTEPAPREAVPPPVVGAIPRVEPEARPEVAPEPRPAVEPEARPEPAPRIAAPPAPAPEAPVPPARPTPAPPPGYAPVAELSDIHFDFDRSDIRPGDARILERNAEWLLANADSLLLIEGHCDERGTNEYNLALGERRARATRDYLAALGVPAARMTTISYGEERPQCIERTEECWAKNRRAHFLVKRG